MDEAPFPKTLHLHTLLYKLGSFFFLKKKLIILEKNTDLLQSWKTAKPLRCNDAMRLNILTFDQCCGTFSAPERH